MAEAGVRNYLSVISRPEKRQVAENSVQLWIGWPGCRVECASANKTGATRCRLAWTWTRRGAQREERWPRHWQHECAHPFHTADARCAGDRTFSHSVPVVQRLHLHQ